MKANYELPGDQLEKNPQRVLLTSILILVLTTALSGWLRHDGQTVQSIPREWGGEPAGADNQSDLLFGAKGRSKDLDSQYQAITNDTTATDPFNKININLVIW